MTTREITTDDDVRWTLTEALVGTDAERDARAVPVVATPSGGEQTLRLALADGWADDSEDALRRAVGAARDDDHRDDLGRDA